MRSALANGELQLHYQPIFDTETGRITICEALMRWQHPELGWISPAEFIPIAESSALIEPMTNWALAQACRDAMGWDEDIRVAVNISPALIKTDGLPRAVISALLQSGLKARRLELEVTESIFLEDDRRTHLILSELRRIGLRLALDDFGTGYSSLGALRTHEFDTIKVDQSFVKLLGQDRQADALCETVLALGKACGLDVVAEGVETPEQLKALQEMGFELGQGYLWAKAMPVDVASKWLTDSFI